jgi:glucosamine--fructose-6-phosphate aminotransferase (isomerizing)
MNGAGEHTREEILSQPTAWAAALDVIRAHRQQLARLSRGGYRQVLFTGCGSTYYLSLAAAALLQELTGESARAVPASELWLNARSNYAPGKTLLVAVSRSGETSETLNACQSFRDLVRQGDLLTLSCYPGRPLARLGNLNVVLEAGQEQSVAQTRAFTVLYLATVALAVLWARADALFEGLDSLPECGARLLDACGQTAEELGQDRSIERFYWLGSGGRYGLACEVSLKMKEMSLSHSEPFHFMEFRHGPKAMVGPSALVVGFQSSSAAEHEAAVLEEVRALEGRTLTVAEDRGEVRLGSGVDELIRNVLYLPVGQRLAFERAIAKGLDPDRPHNLDAVVKLP